MADDIVARMRLNAKEFTSEFGNVLDFSEARAKRAGEQISGAFGRQAGEGVRALAAEIPIVGNAVSGLSGPLLFGAAGLGALAIGFGSALKASEEYETATRQLDAVLKATGNTTGLTSDALKDYAETLESAFAIDAEEFLKAEQVLSSFSGIAGDSFKRAAKDAADMAAVFGGDLSSNSEKLGTVLQALAQGEVTGLSKGFKFLGAASIDVISRLAEAGQAAAAQTALFEALENKIGGAGEAKAAGVSGAYFRFKDAIGDATRELATQSGILPTLADGFDILAKAIQRATGTASTTDKIVDKIQQLAKTRADLAKLEAGFFGNGSVPAIDAKNKIKRLEAEIASLQVDGRRESQGVINEQKAGVAAAEKAAKDGQAKRDRAAADDAAKRSASDAASAAKQAASARASAAQELDKYLRGLEQQAELVAHTREDQELITAELKAQELAVKAGHTPEQQKADKDRVAAAVLFRQALEGGQAALEAMDKIALTNLANVKIGGDLSNEHFIGESGRARDQAALDNDRAAADRKRRADDIADYFESAMSGGIDELSRHLEDDLNRAFGNGLSKIFDNLKNRQGPLNGLDATDQAAIGSSIGLSLAKAAGLKTSKLGGDVGAAAGAASGIPGGQFIGQAIGSIVGGLFKKTPSGSISVEIDSNGTAGVGSFTGTKKLTAEVTALGNAFTAALQQIADSLNGALVDNVALGSLGKKGKKYTFDPDGAGKIKATKYDTAEEAQTAAERYAISSGAVSLSAGARNLALGRGDFAAQLNKAQQYEAVFTELDRLQDPVAAGIEALNKQFKGLIGVFNEAGASTEDLTKLQQLYDLKLKDINETAKATTDTLQSFLSSLNVGSNSPLSLRDQEATAKAAYAAAAGSIGTASFDQEKFASAGRALLDLEKQINGSTSDFFAVFDQVRGDTERSIAAITNAQAIAPVESPFVKKTADATAATADNTSTMIQLLSQIAANMNGTGGDLSNFIGNDLRAFV